MAVFFVDAQSRCQPFAPDPSFYTVGHYPTVQENLFSESDELLELLAELRRAQPELRLGQLVATLSMVARGDQPGGVWEVEDAELVDAARWHLSQLGIDVARV